MNKGKLIYELIGAIGNVTDGKNLLIDGENEHTEPKVVTFEIIEAIKKVVNDNHKE